VEAGLILEDLGVVLALLALDRAATERTLERVRERQGRGGRRHAPCRRATHDGLIVRDWLLDCASLHHRRDDLFDQGLLTRRRLVRAHRVPTLLRLS
jgi:hypothetical protein